MNGYPEKQNATGQLIRERDEMEVCRRRSVAKRSLRVEGPRVLSLHRGMFDEKIDCISNAVRDMQVVLEAFF